MLTQPPAAGSSQALKHTLDTLYHRYNRRALIPPDPLQFVYRYSDPLDREIAGFVAAGLAYGRVRQIAGSVDRLLTLMDASPSRFVLDFDPPRSTALQGFRHRFTSGRDICDLFTLLQWVLLEYGSIELCFLACSESADRNMLPVLSRFCALLSDRYRTTTGRGMTTGLKYLLSDPARKSACKRMNLFLRWMVRSDAVDPGVWKSVDPVSLIVPVDAHMARLCRIIGLHDRKSVSLPMAIQITEAFKDLAPDDPVKYDFALSRIGIVEDCDGRYRARCDACELLNYCLKRENWPNGSREA
mgnify:FL=1